MLRRCVAVLLPLLASGVVLTVSPGWSDGSQPCVSGVCPSLAAAFQTVASGDVISLGAVPNNAVFSGPGNQGLTAATLATRAVNDLTITGEFATAPAFVQLSGDRFLSVVDVAPFTLVMRSFTIDNGTVTNADGGAVLFQASAPVPPTSVPFQITLSGVIINNCTSSSSAGPSDMTTGRGGAVFFQNATPRIGLLLLCPAAIVPLSSFPLPPCF